MNIHLPGNFITGRILYGLLVPLLLVSCQNKGPILQSAAIQAIISTEGDRTFISSPHTLQDQEKFIWGASVIQGEDGNYHMFYSTWDTGPENTQFSNAWVLYSEIAYAVSPYPDRDFIHVATILRGRRYEGDTLAWDAQAVHNPHIQKFNGLKRIFLN